MPTPMQSPSMARAPRMAHCLAAFAALLLCSCATNPPPLPDKAKPVVALMARRLEIARDVAWTKRVNHLPVRDPAREAAVLERTLRGAETAGLDSATALHFMRAQIEASCLQQESWMDAWKQGQALPPGAPPSLGEIRSRLDSSSAQLLAELTATKNQTIPIRSVTASLIDAGVSPAAARAAAAGLAPTTR